MDGYDMETLMTLKNSFQANEFQWIKTTDQTKLGKIVTVRDVVPGRNSRFIAILSDGSQFDTDLISSNLMMLSEDQPAMSMVEVQSINYVPSLSDGLDISPDIPSEYAHEFKQSGISLTPIPGLTPGFPEQLPQPIINTVVDTTDIFGMFSLEEITLNLAVKVKLPSKNLLKMMYQNSKNKDEFLTKLANYINSNVTVDAIKKTMKSSLSATDKSKNQKSNE